MAKKYRDRNHRPYGTRQLRPRARPGVARHAQCEIVGVADADEKGLAEAVKRSRLAEGLRRLQQNDGRDRSRTSWPSVRAGSIDTVK